jgi:hypothetical protein
VLIGAPGHALEVHELTVCPTPVSFVHVTELPTATVADSGLKQNSVPPPLQAPPRIVILEVVDVDASASVRVALAMGTRVARNAPSDASTATPPSAVITIRRRVAGLSVRAMSYSLR